MSTQHLLSVYSSSLGCFEAVLDTSGLAPEALEHLLGMNANLTSHSVSPQPDTLEPALTLAELAAQLGVRTQAIYDLRSQGRGPRGFRVGRELRFRVSEVRAWVARMEEADADRHPEVS